MIYAILAYISWGLIPAYLKLLTHIPITQVLFHRSLWAFLFFSLMLIYSKKLLSGLKSLTHRQKLTCIGTASLIGINWGIYLYAMNTNQVIESSLGYFINPLINMILGTLILKESLSRPRKIAVGLAGLGVLWLTFLAGHFPWIGLSLGLTFGFYGLFRKVGEIPMTTALQVESFILTLVMAGIFFLYHPHSSLGAPSGQPLEWLLLIGAGLATGLPLFWFSKATKTTPLNVLGFLQFISPTLQFLLGAFLYNEPFPFSKMIGFLFIWSGVALLIAELIYSRRQKFKKEELQKI